MKTIDVWFNIFIFQLRNKSKNAEESMAKQVDDINDAISMARDEYNKQQSELRKSIENIVGTLRADNNTNLTAQVDYTIHSTNCK